MTIRNKATKPPNIVTALDPVQLAIKAGLKPDPWQKKFLRSTADQVLLNCSRQAGKSTIAAVLAVHTAVFKPGSLVLLLSPSLRQSQEIFKKAQSVYWAARTDSWPRTVGESALRIELSNGSRIISLPGQEAGVRGYSAVDILIVDEAARVDEGLIAAARPMLAVSGGRLLALSTPWGDSNWFYDAWHTEDDWERYEVPATECPRIPAAFLQRERKNLGPFFYQEYMCQFLAAADQVFDRQTIAALIDEDLEPFDFLRI